VWCSNGNEVDFDWLRAHNLHKWRGCRGLIMSDLGRTKSSVAFYDIAQLHICARVLCEDISFTEMVMLDTSRENVLCARSLGIDARLVSNVSDVLAVLEELRHQDA
jgi:hypothetical protein